MAPAASLATGSVEQAILLKDMGPPPAPPSSVPPPSSVTERAMDAGAVLTTAAAADGASVAIAPAATVLTMAVPAPSAGRVLGMSAVLPVYISVGQLCSGVARVQRFVVDYDAVKYSSIVDAAAAHPAGLRYSPPYAGTTLGKEFVDSGRPVLAVYEGLPNRPVYYRHVSFALGSPPGHRACGWDLFYLHSRLLRRSAAHALTDYEVAPFDSATCALAAAPAYAVARSAMDDEFEVEVAPAAAAPTFERCAPGASFDAPAASPPVPTAASSVAATGDTAPANHGVGVDRDPVAASSAICLSASMSTAMSAAGDTGDEEASARLLECASLIMDAAMDAIDAPAWQAHVEASVEVFEGPVIAGFEGAPNIDESSIGGTGVHDFEGVRPGPQRLVIAGEELEVGRAFAGHEEACLPLPTEPFDLGNLALPEVLFPLPQRAPSKPMPCWRPQPSTPCTHPAPPVPTPCARPPAPRERTPRAPFPTREMGAASTLLAGIAAAATTATLAAAATIVAPFAAAAGILAFWGPRPPRRPSAPTPPRRRMAPLVPSEVLPPPPPTPKGIPIWRERFGVGGGSYAPFGHMAQRDRLFARRPRPPRRPHPEPPVPPPAKAEAVLRRAGVLGPRAPPPPPLHARKPRAPTHKLPRAPTHKPPRAPTHKPPRAPTHKPPRAPTHTPPRAPTPPPRAPKHATLRAHPPPLELRLNAALGRLRDCAHRGL